MKQYAKFLDDGFVLTSSHEPLIFYRRTGRLNIHSTEDFERMHDEESVLKLKKAGLTVWRFHFHKGFGFEAERADREMTRAATALCHKHGIKVQTYIPFQSMVSETTREEAPDFDDWIMRDEHGKPLTIWFGHQFFRNFPCLNRDGFWNNLKKAVHSAIVECGVDAIGFDNVCWAVEPDVCHCDACKAAFTEYLTKRYPTKEAAIERFGHAHIKNIQPPVWNYYNSHLNLTEIRQPDLQEWINFKSETLKKRIDQMYNYAKSLNPDVLIEINASMQTGQNAAFHMGIYQNDLASGCDAFWNEVDPDPDYRDGLLLNKVRIFKSTTAMDKMMFTGHRWNGKKETEDIYRLCMAESMVYQHGGINCISMFDTFRIKDFEPDAPHKVYASFSRENRELYWAAPVPAVHLYESRPSLCYSNFESQYALVLMSQILLREKIPFNVLHSLDDLSACKTIVLPETMCLSENEVDKLAAFVENGGGVVLTGTTGDFNENYIGLADHSLKTRLGLAGKQAPCAVSFGKGRAAMLPRLSSAHDFTAYDFAYRPAEESQVRVKFESWEAPDNMRQAADAIRWTLRNDLPVQVNAPEPVVCELTQDGDMQYLHLLNYDVKSPARMVTAAFRENIKKAELVDPQTGAVTPLAVDGNAVIVDEVKIYAIVKAYI